MNNLFQDSLQIAAEHIDSNFNQFNPQFNPMNISESYGQENTKTLEE